jgi:hypothetical protein
MLIAHNESIKKLGDSNGVNSRNNELTVRNIFWNNKWWYGLEPVNPVLLIFFVEKIKQTLIFSKFYVDFLWFEVWKV